MDCFSKNYFSASDEIICWIAFGMYKLVQNI
jgi:hypothetical protein